jgi:quinol monooxygenase YgiN
MMISLLKVIAVSNKRDAILEVLRSVIDHTWGLPGCLGSACYEEQKSEGAVLYVEQWETKEGLYRHIQSDLYHRVISAMELAVVEPEIRFHEVSQSMGMELIESLRTDLRLANPLRECEVVELKRVREES